ncbi:hypothetical protein BC833DRAFT_600162 [Globomyces pollinis-pini]|nr:hypothetical protein BC833DRAFT_600162 [Globomyces pollinis-pini]
MTPKICPQEPNAWKVVFGVLICLGILISYVPQFYAIHANKSSKGISIWFLFLGLIGTVSTISNVVLLQSQSISCCLTDWPISYCLQDTLGIIQTALQFICFSTVVILVYKHFPVNTAPDEETEELLPKEVDTDVSWNTANNILFSMIFYLAITFTLVSVLLCLESLVPNTNLKSTWAGILGMIAVISGIFQYLPQVVFTAVKRDFGALSIQTLLMQSPGSFAFAFSLSLQPGTNWTSWISFIICGSFQLMLILMFFGFKVFPSVSEEVIIEPEPISKF